MRTVRGGVVLMMLVVAWPAVAAAQRNRLNDPETQRVELFQVFDHQRTEMYVDRVRRLLAMDDLEVTIPNHAAMGQIFEWAARLKNRQLWEPHPFGDRDGFADRLVELLAHGEKKLAEERANAGR